MGAEGLPKGVVRSFSWVSVRPAMLYKPEPPMIASAIFSDMGNSFVRVKIRRTTKRLYSKRLEGYERSQKERRNHPARAHPEGFLPI
jgi:hypothetical protein